MKRKFISDACYMATQNGEPVVAYCAGNYWLSNGRREKQEYFDWIGPRIKLNKDGTWKL